MYSIISSLYGLAQRIGFLTIMLVIYFINLKRCRKNKIKSSLWAINFFIYCSFNVLHNIYNVKTQTKKNIYSPCMYNVYNILLWNVDFIYVDNKFWQSFEKIQLYTGELNFQMLIKNNWQLIYTIQASLILAMAKYIFFIRNYMKLKFSFWSGFQHKENPLQMNGVSFHLQTECCSVNSFIKKFQTWNFSSSNLKIT